MSYYYPMIKSVFEEEEKYHKKNGTDDIGEWYLFQYLSPSNRQKTFKLPCR